MDIHSMYGDCVTTLSKNSGLRVQCKDMAAMPVCADTAKNCSNYPYVVQADQGISVPACNMQAYKAHTHLHP